MDTKTYRYENEFELESGEKIFGLEIAYCTYGKLNEARDNAIYVCHALTANAELADWWPDTVGKGLISEVLPEREDDGV